MVQDSVWTMNQSTLVKVLSNKSLNSVFSCSMFDVR